jgi:hypothetical protein
MFMSHIIEPQNYNAGRPQGYIALIAVMIVAAAALTVGISVSLSGISEIQTSFAEDQGLRTKMLANTCIEEGLKRLHGSWTNYAGGLSVDGNSCIINTVVSGLNATVNATGTIGIYQQKIQAQVDSNFEVLAWEEE